MRRVLLASAALFTRFGLAGQCPDPCQSQPGSAGCPYGAGPAANNNNNAWGIANTPSGSAAAGPLSTIFAPNVDAVPAPGTIVIRLNGRVEVDITANYTSVDRGLTPMAHRTASS